MVVGPDMQDCPQSHWLHQLDLAHSAADILKGYLNVLGSDADLYGLAILTLDTMGRRNLLS
jgi:hypothetical protein